MEKILQLYMDLTKKYKKLIIEVNLILNYIYYDINLCKKKLLIVGFTKEWI
jgi:hypothetical protein